jgi:hypothetical protein
MVHALLILLKTPYLQIVQKVSRVMDMETVCQLQPHSQHHLH